MTLIIIVCAIMALFCILMFLFGLSNYVTTRNKRQYRFSLSILFLSFIWMGMGVLAYLSYLQQISL